MILAVHERLALLNMLPSEGGYEELQTIRRTREMLSFDQDESKSINLRNEKDAMGNPVVQWDTENANKLAKDVPIDEWTTNHFRKKLAELEANGKLKEQLMSLYEKFVIMYK